MRLQRWLGELGPRYETWAHQCALQEVETPVLRAAFSSTFSRGNADTLKNDPQLLAGVASMFPGCTAVRTSVRAADSELATRRELDQAERAAAREALRAEMAAHPLVLQVSQVLGARLAGVSPHAEGPELK